MRYSLFLLVVVLLISCQNIEYSDLDEFSIEENALKEGEEFKVIYSLTLAQNDNTENAFNHYIVISQESGDTVNLLSSGASPVRDRDEVFSFSSKYNNLLDLTLESHMQNFDLDSALGNRKIDEIEADRKIDPSRKVLRDSKFDSVAKNSHPTIIGHLTKVTKNN
jgi:hypothetical protein